MNKNTPKIFCGFRKRSTPLIADYRPMYKIGLITIILRLACIGNKASLSKLHLLIWALKSENNRKKILAELKTNGSEIFAWGVEPALNKSLSLAVSEGLLELSDDKYSLTKLGVDVYQLIEKSSDLFIEEKKFLQDVGKKSITEQTIKSLSKKN